MGIGAGLYMYVMYDVVVKLFKFDISSPDEFLYKRLPKNRRWLSTAPRTEPLFAARKSGQRQYDIPRESSSVGSRAFSVAIPKVWNQLPPSVSLMDCVVTIVTFKCHLKNTVYRGVQYIALTLTSGYATWFTAGGAIRIAHYDVTDDMITRKL